MNTDTKTLAAELRRTAGFTGPADILEQAADRLEELERELASKDAHSDEIYKAAVDLAKKLEDDLEKERAIADRLAHWLETLLSGYEDAKEISAFNGEEAHAADRAIKAWKEARRE
jgi:hypothetical protein